MNMHGLGMNSVSPVLLNTPSLDGRKAFFASQNVKWILGFIPKINLKCTLWLSSDVPWPITSDRMSLKISTNHKPALWLLRILASFEYLLGSLPQGALNIPLLRVGCNPWAPVLKSESYKSLTLWQSRNFRFRRFIVPLNLLFIIQFCQNGHFAHAWGIIQFGGEVHVVWFGT